MLLDNPKSKELIIVPKEQIMLQAILLLLAEGAMFVSVLLGLVFVVRAFNRIALWKSQKRFGG